MTNVSAGFAPVNTPSVIRKASCPRLARRISFASRGSLLGSLSLVLSLSRDRERGTYRKTCPPDCGPRLIYTDDPAAKPQECKRRPSNRGQKNIWPDDARRLSGDLHFFWASRRPRPARQSAGALDSAGTIRLHSPPRPNREIST